MSNNQINLEERNEIIRKLSNFLKLPKAQRWICCEWFYSDIDRVIFESENDFALCIKQSFPRLKTQKLRRKQWCILRNLIGKPRRCSDAFFQEERQMLEEKRQKIRLIQQRKISENELIDLKDLPQEIPLTLSIGNRVYTHICHPEEGVFLGTIAAVDPVEHTYRVVFDRSSIGSQTVHDYEIKSVNPIQTIPIKAYIQTYRPKATTQSGQVFSNTPNLNLQTILANKQHLLTPNSTPGVNNILIDDLNSLNANNHSISSALMMQSNLDPITGNYASPLNDLNSHFQTHGPTGRLGGFPIHLLLMVTRLNKIIQVKKENLKKLDDLNVEAERIKANSQEYGKEFQVNYANIVLELEKLNKDLNDYLTGLQSYCEEYSSEFRLNESSFRTSSGQEVDLKKYYFNESVDLINKIEKMRKENRLDNKQIEDNLNKIHLNENSLSNQSELDGLNLKIKSKHTSDLVVKFTSLLLQIKDYVNSTSRSLIKEEMDTGSNNELQHQKPFLPFCTKTLNESIDDIKKSIKSSSNVELFEDKVQVHINHIQSVLCHYNKLHAFKFELDNQSENE